MKLLIAYDGSSSADNALDDLQRAGLPKAGVETLIISVAEVWMPPQTSTNGDEGFPDYIKELTEKRHKVAENSIHEAETMSRHARERVLAHFPDWNVKADVKNGSPGWEILFAAEEFEPDLIVVGSQGRNAVGRFLLGSISQKILREAACSVRIGRGKIEVDPAPERIIIGFDGSVGSKIATKEALSRSWPEGTEAALITAVHSPVPTAIGRFIPPVKEWVEDDIKSETEWIQKTAEDPIEKFKEIGVTADVRICEGNPKEVLVEQAAKWQADCIFVGAHSYANVLERFLIGSTSAAVAERASCSVEVVRQTVDF
ncbi:MAG: universal stress protein [Pyrinomonadaceae bacterium]